MLQDSGSPIANAERGSASTGAGLGGAALAASFASGLKVGSLKIEAAGFSACIIDFGIGYLLYV
jgi:hypothetical protein